MTRLSLNQPSLHYPTAENHQNAAIDSQPSSFGLRDLLRVVWRRRMLLAMTALAVLVCGTYVLFQLTPLYTATAQVMLDPNQTTIVNIQSLNTPLTEPDKALVDSEKEVLKSERIARQVIADLNLHQVQEFLPEEEGTGFLASLTDEATAFLGRFGLANPLASAEGFEPEREPASYDPRELALLDAFQQRLSVSSAGESWVINVAFTSEDPALSARVANAVVETYLAQKVASAEGLHGRASDYLGERLDVLRQDMEKAQQRVEEYRRTHGLVEGKDSALVREQISDLSLQLTEAEAARDAVVSRLRNVESLVQREGPLAVFDMVDATPIQHLRELEADARRRLGELSSTYGPQHPIIINVNSEVEAINSRMEAAARNALNGIRQEAQIANERVTELRASLNRLKQESGEVYEAESELGRLVQEAETSRTLYQTFLTRMKEMESMGLHEPQANVIAEAQVPADPSFPNKPLLFAITLLVAGTLGSGAVFAAEQLEGGIRNSRDIERLIGARVLGSVPHVPHGIARTRKPHDYVLAKPMSAYAEALRSVYTSFMFAPDWQNHTGMTAMVTSATAGEGKSTIAASLTRIVGRSGVRVLIIDCDFRRPQIHALFGLSNDVGLTNVLRGEAALSDAVQRDPKGTADVIVAGSPSEDSLALLRSEAFHQFLMGLKVRKQYDLIIIDAPPILPIPDARVIAHKADSSILVVEWRKTDTDALKHAHRHLLEAGRGFRGCVINKVNVKQAHYYGLSDGGYYASSNGRYYHN